jgi:hypothetical protein
MKLLVSIWTEAVGLIIDDSALAALCAGLIAVLAAAVLWLSHPPLIAGALLLVGCIAILAWSVGRAARKSHPPKI